MNPAPLVSIAIPAFSPQFFNAALQSALSQTYTPLEVIVCDDSMGDEIHAIVQACTVPQNLVLRYVRNKQRLGFQGNLIACAEEATGEYLKLLCDDDQLLPECVARQVQGFIGHDDVSLVIAQRQFCDGDYALLPERLENSSFTSGDTLFKGEDLLDVLESSAVNFLSGLSGALLRTRQVLEYLPALTQMEAGFVARLDLALFVCLLRRGNLAVVSQVLSFERLHKARLSNQPEVQQAVLTELGWLSQMLAVRSGEPAPAPGYARYIDLTAAAKGEPYAWEEISLTRSLGFTHTLIRSRVGMGCDSFGEVYRQWLSCRTLNPAQQRLLPTRLASWAWQPRIVPVVIDAQADGAALRMTLESIERQVYAAETVVVLSSGTLLSPVDGNVISIALEGDGFAQLNGVLADLEGADWFYLVRAGDRLNDLALLLLAERVVESADALCIYSDEGGLRDELSVEPIFKADFNLDLLRSYPYIGRTLAMQRRRFLAVGGFDPAYAELSPHDVVWRLVEGDGAHVIEHVAQVLVESTFGLSQWLSLSQVVEQNPRVLAAHLDRIGVRHQVRVGDLPLINRVDYQHEHQPLVSIIIVARDRIGTLQRCVERVLEHTAYAHYELLIVDSGSITAEARDWFAAMEQMGSDKLRILRCDYPENPAAAQNFAAGQARGEYLVLLSTHCQIVSGDWLHELLNHGMRPEVGVVGGRMVSPQGRIEGSALILGMRGPVGVPWRGEPLNTSGYMQRQQTVQNLSAVGAECLLIRKQIFDDLQGFDEQAFAQMLNGPDLCLRVRRSGYLVVWTPYAESVQVAAEGINGPVAQSLLAEQKNFYQRWLPIIARDPAYNTNLSLGTNNFNLEPGSLAGWNPFTRHMLPRVLAIPINETAVGHYRVTQPFLELEAAGRVLGHLSFHTPSDIELERQAPDVIILQGRYSQSAVDEVERVKNCSRAFRIFELDDYVIKVPKKNAHVRKAIDGVEDIVRRGVGLCDRVVVSTQPLADTLKGMHHDIRVVPNMLAPHLWTGLTSQRRTSRKPRVGWGGGTSHDGDLAIIADVVRILADEVDWVFFGMCPPSLRGYVREFYPAIGLQAYPAKLASLNLDLALAPLEFHIFNDCKSNLRLLEYGACGYPVICTDTEAYRGYLPCTKVVSNSTEEWLAAIRMHLADPEASYRMGDALREEVLRDYMLRGDNLNYWINGWLPD
ncbi:glycosyltransferase [Pseudomonas purpurea]|uniref:glycosyltransferase n=1 Tax=Pseudomonas purpurea TaxID=3136737 RepID=UPI003267ECAB